MAVSIQSTNKIHESNTLSPLCYAVGHIGAAACALCVLAGITATVALKLLGCTTGAALAITALPMAYIAIPAAAFMFAGYSLGFLTNNVTKIQT